MTVNVAIPDEVREIMEKPGTYIAPADVGKVLKISPLTVRLRAKAGVFGFPYYEAGKNGTWMRFPKIPFLRWLGYDVNFEGEAV